MTIGQVYKKYKILPNLQEHMLRVAKVATFICEHWTGPQLDRNLIKQAALTHDLGNMVRFDFRAHPEFLGKEAERLDYWLSVQRNLREKYGREEHRAAVKILKQAGASRKLMRLLSRQAIGRSERIVDTGNWELKILHYSDFRVGPFGMLSIRQRLDDLYERRKKLLDKRQWQRVRKAFGRLEQEIGKRLDRGVDTITARSVKRSDGEFLNLELTGV